MPDQRDSTIPQRPFPKRPGFGLMAWIATIGYISTQTSPDAILKLLVNPAADGSLLWSAQASWAQYREQAVDRPSIGAALADLWREVDNHHMIFETQLDAARAPIDYNENEWLDGGTEDMLHRLIVTANNAFADDWQLAIVYQPVDTPETRVQARLVARGDSVQIGGHGPSVKDACRDVYRNGAREFIRRSSGSDE